VATGEVAARITLKHLDTLPEFREAVRLQKEIWGFSDIELLPLRLFVVAHKVGGQIIGAFDGAQMIGFLVSIPGIRPSAENAEAYLHSHMMGVQAPYRNLGVGRMLKLAQREEALARGVRLVEWTFDPLEIKNAYFNIERLGAVVRRYVLNQYGTTTSHLHGGLPTDRCVAEWYLDGERVRAVLDGKPVPHTDTLERVAVPNGIAELRQHHPKQAREIQRRLSETFLAHFQRGLAVTGFERTPDAGVYLFSQWVPQWPSK
jgi:predicted GNAT superfamily acetyltransferase